MQKRDRHIQNHTAIEPELTRTLLPLKRGHQHRHPLHAGPQIRDTVPWVARATAPQGCLEAVLPSCRAGGQPLPRGQQLPQSPAPLLARSRQRAAQRRPLQPQHARLPWVAWLEAHRQWSPSCWQAVARRRWAGGQTLRPRSAGRYLPDETPPPLHAMQGKHMRAGDFVKMMGRVLHDLLRTHGAPAGEFQ